MKLMTVRLPLLGACSALLVSTVMSQPALEWFHKAPSVSGTPYTYGGVAFSLGDQLYFGTGETNNSPSDLLYCFDPVTNAVNICQAVPGGARRNAIAVTIGQHAYVGLGDQGAGWPALSDIHRLNGSSGYFDQSYAFPGGPRSNAIAFTINGKVYIGGGNDGLLNKNDLWEWEPAANTWTPRANMPSSISGGVAFALAGKGYVVRNGSAQLWAYDPVSNTWTTKASFPGTPRTDASAFVLNGRGFVGLGDTGGSQVKDFFAYEPVADSWSTAPYLWSSYGRMRAMATTHQGKAYVTGGFSYSPMDFDLWELGPSAPVATGVWVQRPFLPAPPRKDPIVFVIGNTAYLGGGDGGIPTYTDLWAYDAELRAWTAKAALPGTMVVAAAVDGKGYGLRNTATGNFWAYDPLADAWSPLADLPVPRASTVAFGLEGKIYVTTGFANNTRLNDLWEYDPQTNAWTQKTSKSGQAVHAAAGFALGNKGYVTGGNTGGTTTATSLVYRYDPASDSWAGVQSMPHVGNLQAHMAFAIGNKGYCGGGVQGGSLYHQNTFRSYDPMANTWSSLPTLGGGWRREAAAFSIGGSGFIACGALNTTSGTSTSATPVNDMWEYMPASIAVAPSVFLGGPYDQVSGLMTDDLIVAGLVPSTDPYSSLLYPRPGGDYSDRSGGQQAMTGNDAIVDRVVVELRDALDPSIIHAARHVLLQRDGDVVDMDGFSPVRFTLEPGDYHVAIRHRNHLGCMSASPMALSSTPATIDLTMPSTPTWGTDARQLVNGTMVLWPGDATFDGAVKYAGAANDRDAILQTIGGSVPTATLSGQYRMEDLNLDGVVKYAGAANDRDVVLQTIGGTVPTATRTTQLP